MLRDAFTYTKEGVFGKTRRWVLLMVATLILTIPLLGYIAKILRAETPAPEVQDWKTLFIDGIKLFIVQIVYFIPIIIIWIIGMVLMGHPAPGMYGTSPYGSYVASSPTPTVTLHHRVHATVSPTVTPLMTPFAYPTVNPLAYSSAYPGAANVAGAGILGLLGLLFGIVIAILLPIAMIRFARSGNFRDAFDIKAILAYIGKIGWISYIIAIIIGGLVVGIPLFILMFIISIIFSLVLGLWALMILPLIMGILSLVLAPLISVFLARYLTRVYDTVTA